LRHYGFRADEILSAGQPDLDLALDPKAGWAILHPEWFPVDLAHAPLESLLRVPGIGVVSARRIMVARRAAPLRLGDLKALGVVMRRARHFIVLGGRRPEDVAVADDPRAVRQALVAAESSVAEMLQPDLFGEEAVAACRPAAIPAADGPCLASPAPPPLALAV